MSICYLVGLFKVKGGRGSGIFAQIMVCGARRRGPLTLLKRTDTALDYLFYTDA